MGKGEEWRGQDTQQTIVTINTPFKALSQLGSRQSSPGATSRPAPPELEPQRLPRLCPTLHGSRTQPTGAWPHPSRITRGPLRATLRLQPHRPRTPLLSQFGKGSMKNIFQMKSRVQTMHPPKRLHNGSDGHRSSHPSTCLWSSL